MRASSFDFIGNLDTLVAVIIGAFLATGGALIAEIIQDRLGRKRREREAARFFGEIMTSIDAIIDLATSSQRIGDKWGRITQRFFRTALREANVYERNRERLFDIQDMDLRFAINEHFLRETVPIIALLEQTDSIDEASRELARSDLSPARQSQLEAEITQQAADREQSLEAMTYQREQTSALIERLKPLAQVSFASNYRRLDEEDEPSGAEEEMAPAELDGAKKPA